MHRTLPLVAVFAAFLGMSFFAPAMMTAQETNDGEMSSDDTTMEEGSEESGDMEGEEMEEGDGEGEMEEGEGEMEAEPEAEPMPEPVEVQEEEEQFSNEFVVVWNNRFQADAKNLEEGPVRFRIGGRIHFHAVGGASTPEGNEAGPQFEPEDGVFFRRARFYIRGKLFKVMSYKFQIDYAGGDVEFKDMFMAFTALGPGSLRFGQYKTFFSIEELTSSNSIPFLERGFVPSMFHQGRQAGFSYHANLADDLFNFAIGVFMGTGDQGQTEDLFRYLISSRFWVSLFNDDDSMDLHFGLSFNQAIFREGTGELRTRSRGIVRTLEGDRIFDREIQGLDGFSVIGVEAAFFASALRVVLDFGGAITAPTDGNPDDGRFIWGLGAIVGYVLTGEKQQYDAGDGDMGSPKPSNFFMVDGGIGAFEAVIRFDIANMTDGLDGAAADGNEAIQFGLGLNWYLNRNARIMATFGYAAVTESANYLFFGMRFQLAV